MRQAVVAAEHNGAALMDGKQLKSARKVMSESGIDGLRVVFCLQLSFIDANQFFPFAGLFPETIVGDPIKPGRKTRFSAKGAEIFVSPQKRLLREVVRERNIGADQLAEQTSHTRLMIPDQFGKGVMVVVDKNACNEVCIGERHAAMLGQRRSFVFRSFKLPDQQVSDADQERDNAERPGAAFPVVHGAKENHQAESDHDQHDATAHVRARPDGWRWGEKSRRHGLAFFDHFPDGAMERAAFQVAEKHDRADHQNGSAKEGREDDADNRDSHVRAVLDPEVITIAMGPRNRDAGRRSNAEVAFQLL